MGLKVKHLPSLFKVPSCTQQPKTSSFRLTTTLDDDVFKTINSVYFVQESDTVETPDSWFTNNSFEVERLSMSTESSSMSISGETDLESIVRGAQLSFSANRRLLFDPSAEDSPKLGPTSSRMVFKRSDIHNFTYTNNNNNNNSQSHSLRHFPKLTSRTLENVANATNNTNDYRLSHSSQHFSKLSSSTLENVANQANDRSGNADTPFKESVAMSMESEDPYEDFKRSMGEMVESLEVKDDWEELEELLGWYLKVNGREYHGYIINAFIDLLGGIIDDKNSSCDESSISDVHGGYKNEIVTCNSSFCSATSSLISSCGSTSDQVISTVVRSSLENCW